MSDVRGDHFSTVSAGYATYRPRYPASLFQALAAVAPVRALAWDCGCGSGQASVALAEWFEQVHATDVSAAQVQAALPHARVTYHVAPAQESGLPDSRAALITVAQALHWFDVDAFHAEATRVLMPGGVIAEWSYALMETPAHPAVSQVVNALDVEVRAWWPPERRHVDTQYADLAFPFTSLDIGAHHMSAEWTPEELLGYLATWSAITRFRAAQGTDPLVACAAALAAAWPASGTVHIRWPLTVRVGRIARS
jgi:SAM-dependent methyltransferase